MFLVALSRFFFRKKALNVLNFWIFLSQKEHLMATFNETCALTSRKYISEPGMSIPNLLEKLHFFLIDSSVYPLQ